MNTAKKIFKAKFLATRAKVKAMTLDKIKYYDEELSYDRSFDDYTNRLIRKRANDELYRHEVYTELPEYTDIDAEIDALVFFPESLDEALAMALAD